MLKRITLLLGLFLHLFPNVLLGQAGRLDDHFQPHLPEGLVARRAATFEDGTILVLASSPANFVSEVTLCWLSSDGNLLRSVPTDWLVDPIQVRLHTFSDGSFIVGGPGLIMNRSWFPVARFLPDGRTDPTFVLPNFDLASSTGLFFMRDGRLLVAGFFRVVGEKPSPSLARLNSDGTIDQTFQSSLDEGTSVTDVIELEDGSLVVFGVFSKVAGVARPGIVKLTSTGALDPTWIPSRVSNGTIIHAKEDSNGRLVVSDDTASFFRLRANGTPDPQYQNRSPSGGNNPSIFDLSIAPDTGGILVAGDFRQPRFGIAEGLVRLSTNGVQDRAFDIGGLAGAVIWQVDPTPDGSALTVGSFQALGGALRPGIARILGGTVSNVVSRFEFATTPVSVREDAGKARVNVRRTSGLAEGADIHYKTLERPSQKFYVPATPGLDFIPTNGLLHFEPGQTSRSIEVSVLQDILGEPEEWIELVLFDPVVPASLGSITNFLVTIVDEDRAFAWEFPSYEVAESAEGLDVHILRFGNLSTAASIHYESIDDSATSGSDFVPVSGVANFAPGAGQFNLHISIQNDRGTEGGERFWLRLSDPSPMSYTLNPPTDTAIYILDDDDSGPGGMDFSYVPLNTLPGYIESEQSLLATAPEGGLYVGVRDPVLAPFGSWQIRRVTSDGLIDASFGLNDNFLRGADVSAADLAGGIWIAGSYVESESEQLVFGIVNAGVDGTVLRLVRLSDANGFHVDAMLPLRDGGVLVAASNQFLLNSQPSLFLILKDGTLDSNFSTALTVDGKVFAISESADGTLLIGGAFSAVNGIPNEGVARVTRDGSLDPSFHASLGGPVGLTRVHSMVELSDGRIVLGGAITRVDGVRAGAVVRLMPDGRSDESWTMSRFQLHPNPGFPVLVTSLVEDGQGRIVASGNFDTVDGFSRSSLVRLFKNGGVDPAFASGLSQGNLLISGNALYLSNGNLHGERKSPFARLFQDSQGFLGRVEWSQERHTVLEQEGVVTLQAVRTGGSAGVMRVDYASIQNTAQAGVDFENVSGTIVFEDGETVKQIEVPVHARPGIQWAREFQLVLSNANGGILGNRTQSVVQMVDAVDGVPDPSFEMDESVRGLLSGLVQNTNGTWLIQETVNTDSFSAQLSMIHPIGKDGSLLAVHSLISANNFGQYALGGDGVVRAASQFGLSVRISQRLLSGEKLDPDQYLLDVPSATSTPNSEWIGLRSDNLSTNALIRFLPQGSVDPTFHFESLDVAPLAIVGVQADGRILLSVPNSSIESNLVSVLRWNIDGSLDRSFRIRGLTQIQSIISLPSGGLAGWVEMPPDAGWRLVRFSDQGDIDAQFRSEVRILPGAVHCGIQQQGDGKLWVWASSYGQGRLVPQNLENRTEGYSLLRLHPDGTIDRTFDPLVSGIVACEQASIQADGRLLVVENRRITNFSMSGARVVRLLNDVPASGWVEFVQGTLQVQESDGAAKLEVVRKGGSQGALTMTYGSLDDSAVAGVDFLPMNGVIHWEDGDASARQIPVSLLSSPLAESTKSFRVNLGSAIGGGGWGDRASMQVSILDRDTTFTFSTNAIAVFEGDGVAVLEVRRIGVAVASQSVDLRILSDTAVPGKDYTDISQTLVFPPGVTSKSISVPLIHNADRYSSSRLCVQLSNPTSPANVGFYSEVCVTIQDLDRPGALDRSADFSTILTYPDEAWFLSDFCLSSSNQVLTKLFLARSTNTSPASFGLARLQLNGGVDAAFAPNDPHHVWRSKAPVEAFASLEDGSTLFSMRPGYGTFSNLLQVLNPTAEEVRSLTLPTFSPTVSGPLLSRITALSDQRAVVGGNFAFLGTNDQSDHFNLFRLTQDGQFDTTFYSDPNLPPFVSVDAMAADGHDVLVTGYVGRSGEVLVYGVFKILSDGHIDQNFQPRVEMRFRGNTHIWDVHVLPNHQFYIGGDFTHVNGIPRQGLARLMPNGDVDPSFDPGSWAFSDAPSSNVRSITTQPDGSVIVAGYFLEPAIGQFDYLKRFSAKGLLDPWFKPRLVAFFNGNSGFGPMHVEAIGEEQLLLGGPIYSLDGQPNKGLVMLNARHLGYCAVRRNPLGGPAALALSIPSGRIARVEGSSDLVHWEVLVANLGSEVTEWNLPSPLANQAEFFRMVTE